MPDATAKAGDWIDVPFRALKEHEGLRLDTFLAARLGKKYSRAAVQKIIDDGLVSRAARPVKASARISEGETVLIRYPRVEEPPVPHETMPVLFQDERIAVISKPGGTLSHPTDKVLHNTVTHLLARQLGRKVYLAHRLDRETSGAMVLALDVDAARSLYEQFVGRGVQKEYLAVVFGAVAWESTVVDAPLGEEGKGIRVRRAVGGANGQSAVTEFRRLATDARLSLVSALPRTGRLHQIRAHLAHLGHPILGDPKYRGPTSVAGAPITRQLLHAWRLGFVHPATGESVEFTAPWPAAFTQVLPSAAAACYTPPHASNRTSCTRGLDAQPK